MKGTVDINEAELLSNHVPGSYALTSRNELTFLLCDTCLDLPQLHFPVTLSTSFLTASYLSLPGAQPRHPVKMTDKLPPMLLNLFAPRPPLRWAEPSDHAPEKRHTPYIGGIGQYMEALREYKDNDGFVPTESWLQKRDRKIQEKKDKLHKLLTEDVKECTAQRT